MLSKLAKVKKSVRFSDQSHDNKEETCNSDLYFIQAAYFPANECNKSIRTMDSIIAYDFKIQPEMFENNIEAQNMLQNEMNRVLKTNNKIITIGYDGSVSNSTISCTNKKYADMNIIWIDRFLDIGDQSQSSDNSVISMLLQNGIQDEQIIYYGIDNLDDIANNKSMYYTARKIKSMGKIINDGIHKKVDSKPVHVCLDMKILNNLDMSYVVSLLNGLNIVAMDIVYVEDNKEMCVMIRELLVQIFGIKKRKVNLFTEDSYFLIYRPVDQTDPHIDIGWYILRGLSMEQRNDLLTRIDTDQIISFDLEIDDNIISIFITKTTINEQQEKDYLSALTINDCTLFPEEKEHMAFELVNL